MLRPMIFLFLVSAVAGTADFQLQPSILLPDAPQLFLNGEECNAAKAGDYVCGDNCTVVLLCVGDGVGGLRPIEVETCDGDFSCDAEAGRCVNETNACVVPSNDITCHGIGMFPDPYSCTAFHICPYDGDQSVRGTCETGRAYDPLTTVCSKEPTDNDCSQFPIRCGRGGDTGVISGNANIYYICVIENDNPSPELYRCPPNEIYDPDLYSCVERKF